MYGTPASSRGYPQPAGVLDRAIDSRMRKAGARRDLRFAVWGLVTSNSWAPRTTS